MIYLLKQNVIQTTVGRKNLGNTHFMIPRFFTSFRRVVEDYVRKMTKECQKVYRPLLYSNL